MTTLAAAASAADAVRPFGEHKWLRLVRGDDRLVAVLAWDGPALVGAAHCLVYHTPAPNRPCRLTAEIVVHPDRRGHGLGTCLLVQALDLAREEGADEIQFWAYGNLPPAQRLAARWQFRPARVLLQCVLDGERLPAQAPSRPDVHLRSFQAARDTSAWLALHRRVFAEHPEQSAWDVNDLRLRLGQPWFDARDFLLVEDVATSECVGFCWVKLPPDPAAPGEIYIIGVDPAARGRGLGSFLVRAGLAHMRARGRSGAMLYVEAGNAPARALYEQLGFRAQHTHVCYGRRRQDDDWPAG